MNPQVVMQLIASVNNTIAILGAALPEKHQMFVSANYKLIDKFLQSEEGKIAAQTFVQDWEAFSGQ